MSTGYTDFQWWNVTKYIQSCTVLKYVFEVLKYLHFTLLYISTELHFRRKYCTFIYHTTTFI